MKKIMTRGDVFSLSYTDFIAFVNQTNVPPGSHSTLTRWIVNSDISESSRLIEFASTTGFSTLNICKKTGSTGLGIDISSQSVNTANLNAQKMGLAHRVRFEHSDATNHMLSGGFTHVIFGAALQFFPSPKKMLLHSLNAFDQQGKVLASPFYTMKDVPESLIIEAESVFGITPTNVRYKDVMNIYEGLRVEYEDRLDIIQESESELEHYCRSTIDRFKNNSNSSNIEVEEACFDRLMSIRVMSNILREYQKYSVLVLGYESEEYPSRYVELF
ncbi:conserved hypothetical protein [Vibrio nigripulchritudo SOn1]|uniref:Methyltransferase domain-containing protein n=1 Tax=Vibrio nigripulchritudo SOn1 TaxID=1238450 RepID=A0AAV2VKJ5_9VIBR|nr:methyltransferase domain-containing protein [Vibrio nigripulchritudo]CCO44994.1 conserved hypothetical protein [Vibrio nigripulchritudo SOn1]